MVRKFCYRQRGRDFGPFTAEEMRTEAADGRIESDAIVWEYGTCTGRLCQRCGRSLRATERIKGLAGREDHNRPPLPLVSDECIFRYVEFVFYKELLAIEEDRQLGVFTREEARERERALLAALQRIGEQLGQIHESPSGDGPAAVLRPDGGEIPRSAEGPPGRGRPQQSISRRLHWTPLSWASSPVPRPPCSFPGKKSTKPRQVVPPIMIPSSKRRLSPCQEQSREQKSEGPRPEPR